MVRHAQNRVNTRQGGESEFVSLSFAAQYYDTSERTIRRMIAEGELDASRLGKRSIRIRRSDLERLARPDPGRRLMGRYSPSDPTANAAVSRASRASQIPADRARRLAAEAKARGDLSGFERFMAAARCAEAGL